MKSKVFDNGRITIIWDKDGITILDAYNGFKVYLDKDIAKYFVYCLEILYKINNAMGSSCISFHSDIQHNSPAQIITQRILKQFRLKGYMRGNYMDIERKDLILDCFKKCFKIKQHKLELEYIDLQDMPIVALIYIKKGLL